MKYDYSQKSTTEEIKDRFDTDVERFSNLNTGQQSTIDAVWCLELITDAAKCVNPASKRMLDIGCGAGNYTLKMLSKIPQLDCTLVDLSLPMLERARERVAKETSGKIDTIQADIRDIALPDNHYDIILAGAVLHHLRGDDEWRQVFKKLYNSLQPGGSMWISDLVIHDFAPINGLFWEKYGEYLHQLSGEAYKNQVFAYIEKEDTPRSINYQMNVMHEAGFTHVEILHKNICFAAFGGIK